jgi:hypothetical protein
LIGYRVAYTIGTGAYEHYVRYTGTSELTEAAGMLLLELIAAGLVKTEKDNQK